MNFVQEDGKKKTFNEINITPLTDIFLVLLILMMVIAPILDQQGLSLAVPEFVNENDISKENKILTVTVDENGKYIINSNEIPEESLFETLKENAKNYPEGLLIQANGQSDHQSVVSLMDNARNAGITSISIVEI